MRADNITEDRAFFIMKNHCEGFQQFAETRTETPETVMNPKGVQPNHHLTGLTESVGVCGFQALDLSRSQTDRFMLMYDI